MRRMFQKKFHFFGVRLRFERRLRNWRVGCADEHTVVPWDREHHTAIARARHHERGVAGQKAAVEHNMRALARSDHRL